MLRIVYDQTPCGKRYYIIDETTVNRMTVAKVMSGFLSYKEAEKRLKEMENKGKNVN